MICSEECSKMKTNKSTWLRGLRYPRHLGIADAVGGWGMILVACWHLWNNKHIKLRPLLTCLRMGHGLQARLLMCHLPGPGIPGPGTVLGFCPLLHLFGWIMLDCCYCCRWWSRMCCVQEVVGFSGDLSSEAQFLSASWAVSHLFITCCCLAMKIHLTILTDEGPCGNWVPGHINFQSHLNLKTTAWQCQHVHIEAHYILFTRDVYLVQFRDH